MPRPTVGGAQMSEQHCNFMINADGATAADLEKLGETVRAKVLETQGVDLALGSPADWRATHVTRVAVLMGGMSSERDVSLVTGAACAEALRRSRL